MTLSIFGIISPRFTTTTLHPIFTPRAFIVSGWRPAMVVELKYNKSADTAIKQIKEKRYQGALSGYSDKILLVGINYG